MPAQSRSLLDKLEGEEREDRQDLSRLEHGSCRQLDDSTDRRKSQAQRLLEFEMWTNDTTLKDMEYSQRRTEKKQRQREVRRHYHKRCWRKVYLPAVLGMVFGAFFTFCATLQSLGGDTFLWDARGALLVVGPVLLGAGFLALMLAAGCTFKHDQEARQRPKTPPEEFLIPRLQFDFEYRRGRPGGRAAAASVAAASMPRADSLASSDFPLPDDLDPSKNYVQQVRPGWPLQPARHEKTMRTRRSASKDRDDDSDNSGGGGGSPLAGLDDSYSSTATWVQFVSSAYGQHPQLTSPLARQNSDCHLVSSSSSSSSQRQLRQEARGSLKEQGHGHSRSHSDLRYAAVRTLSLTSSGYQSSSDCASGTAAAECQTSSFESSHRKRSGSIYTTTLRPHTVRHPTNHTSTAKHPAGGSQRVDRTPQSGNGILRGSRDSGVQRIYPELGMHTPLRGSRDSGLQRFYPELGVHTHAPHRVIIHQKSAADSKIASLALSTTPRTLYSGTCDFDRDSPICETHFPVSNLPVSTFPKTMAH